jgi:HD superfamily phosphohydrolase
MSIMMMHELNTQFNGKLSLAIEIFTNKYPKKFLHQLVSGQLDMDRLDYLMRDSFYTGVSEGVISFDRIIKMLNIHNDELVIDDKGIYSVEKFIVARRLMYWQVYLHHTVLAAENQLVNVMQRARELTQKNQTLFATPALQLFLQNDFSENDFHKNPQLLNQYALLDDYDVFASVKVWAQHDDFILSHLCRGLINRRLYKLKLQHEEYDPTQIKELQQKTKEIFKVTDEQTNYFVFSKSIANHAYSIKEENINILFKDGSIADIAKASDNLGLVKLTKPVVKYYLCLDETLGL